MHSEVKGSTYELIQGLQCWLPKRPQLQDIQGYYQPKKKQKWQRTELPVFQVRDITTFSGTEYEPGTELEWDAARREEFIKQTGTDPWNMDRDGNPKSVPGVTADPNYFEPALDDFRKQEIDRILNGHWVMIKGKPVYLTGFHYFYLNWWKLNTGYPEFRDTDRQLFYFWQYCLEDKNSYGLIEITKRGVGKSYRVGAVAYLMCILFKNSHIGMQSKTDDDAQELFLTKIVEPMKELPEFLVPLNNHGTSPKNKLNFFAPARKGRSANFVTKDKIDELKSWMDYKNAGETAYDGTTLRFLIQDEIGKLDPKIGDAQKRLGVNRNCVYRDSKMVGKIWATTTVEDMEKGGDAVMRIYNDSDITKRSGIGRTKSGLYRFFTSALDCSHYDEYGYPDREKAREEHDAERKMKEGDSVEYTGYVQRNPYTIEEAFMITGKDCIYNAKILQERQIACQEPGNGMTVQGDFVWDIPDEKAKFIPNPANGRWMVSWMPSKKEDQNKVRTNRMFHDLVEYFPENLEKIAAAHDPFSHAGTVDKRKSNGATAFFRNYDPWDVENSDTFVADYVYRTEDPEECYEDQIIACFFYGAPILIENNKNAAIQYFKKRGYGPFIMKRPENTFTRDDRTQETDGIPSNEPIIEYYIKAMKTHIVKHGHKLKHLRIIRDLLNFDPAKRTKFDLGVASQLALIAAEKRYEKSIAEADVGDLFPSWDNSGSWSQ